MRRPVRILATLLQLALGAYAHAQAPTLRISWVAAPPFAMEDAASPEPGFAVELVKAVFQRKGYTIIASTLPPIRFFAGLKEGTIDIVPGLPKGDAYLSIYSEKPIGPKLQNTFISRKEDGWMFKDLDSLQGKVMGTLTDTTTTKDPGPRPAATEPMAKQISWLIEDQVFRKTGMVEISYSDRGEVELLDKLMGRRIDLFISDRIRTMYAARSHGIPLDSLAFDPTDVLPSRGIFVAFPSATGKAAELKRIFDAGIEELRASGELRAILDRYGLGGVR